jgi:hypothetical protein
MGKFSDLFLLLLFGAAIGLWLKQLRAHERAVAEARLQCVRHGLQLLDESVGLRGIRLRRLDGQLALERSYGFEVSIDGDDREPGRLWMAGDTLTGLNLPTVKMALADHPSGDTDAPAGSGSPGNVVPLRPGLRKLQPPT